MQSSDLNHVKFMVKIQRCIKFSQSQCRDNVCPPLSSPMTSFGIELYETKSANRKFLSTDTMFKAKTQKIILLPRILLLIDPEKTCFLYN